MSLKTAKLKGALIKVECPWCHEWDQIPPKAPHGSIMVCIHCCNPSVLEGDGILERVDLGRVFNFNPHTMIRLAQLMDEVRKLSDQKVTPVDFSHN